MVDVSSGEEALMTKLVGTGSRKGSTWFSRAGDVVQQPPFWAGLATGLSVTGATGRRAALRGSVCYLTASAVHIVIKPIVGRSRPKWSGWMRVGPVTSSFPSGHAASDLAFVLGASQESRLMFIPLSGLSIAAHWSIVRSRGHYLSDVLVGGALSFLVAGVAGRLWPPSERTES